MASHSRGGSVVSDTAALTPAVRALVFYRRVHPGQRRDGRRTQLPVPRQPPGAGPTAVQPTSDGTEMLLHPGHFATIYAAAFPAPPRTTEAGSPQCRCLRVRDCGIPPSPVRGCTHDGSRGSPRPGTYGVRCRRGAADLVAFVQVMAMWRGTEERSVKPSAQPTLVRTQHLPPPAKTARSLRKRGPAGRFLLVPPCVIVCRCRSWRSDRYGHIADSVRAEGAVRGTACFADPRPFCPVTRAPGLPRLTGACRASRRPVLRRSAPAGRRAGLVRTCGRGRLPDRPAPSHRGCHGGGDRVRVARRRVEDWHGAVVSDAAPRIWTLRERRRHAARVSRCPLSGTGSG